MYFCDFPIEDTIQPGCHIRRINGKRLNDLEMKEYYKQVATQHGRKISFRYRNGLAIVFGPNKYYTIFDETSSSLHYLYDHEVDVEREVFPLYSISTIQNESVHSDTYRNFIEECLEQE